MRSTRYASPDDISFESVVEVGFTAEVLQAFDGEDDQGDERRRAEARGREGLRALRRASACSSGTAPGTWPWTSSPPSPADGSVSARCSRPCTRRARRTSTSPCRVPGNARRDGYIEVLGGGSIGAGDPVLHRRRGVRRRHRADASTSSSRPSRTSPRGTRWSRGCGSATGQAARAGERAAGRCRRRARGHRLPPRSGGRTQRAESRRCSSSARFSSPIFVLPDQWDLPVVLAAAVIEVAETFFWLWYSRRRRVQMGPETLVGRERAGGHALRAAGPGPRPGGALARALRRGRRRRRTGPRRRARRAHAPGRASGVDSADDRPGSARRRPARTAAEPRPARSRPCSPSRTSSTCSSRTATGSWARSARRRSSPRSRGAATCAS